MKIAEIVKITGGKLVSGSPAVNVNTGLINTDSRTIRRGDFFIPLKGNNFDGEKFVGEALAKGAIGALISGRTFKPHDTGKVIIRVKDTAKALQRIAHYHRMKFNIPVIGITGSNGKTTTKDMVAHVLSGKFNVLKNEGTKNNHIGLPLTLLKLDNKHDICVLEMGTNHKGEIRLLADIARPGIAVITNIGPSHLKFLKDLKGVFEAKKEILYLLDKKCIAIVNGDDQYLSKLKKQKFKIIKFGFDEKNDLRASLVSAGFGRIEFLLNDKENFKLNLLGTHSVYNALVTIAIARHFGMGIPAIRERLASYKPSDMRLNVRNIDGIMVIDDAYNSNPLSMSCALRAMKDLPASAKWVVSADMLELGKEQDNFHREIGEYIANCGFKGLLTFGRLSRYTHDRAIECGMDREKAWHCSTRDEVAQILRRVARKGDAVLVKGSRAMKMEEVIEKLKGS